MTERQALIALNLVTGIGAVTVRKLSAHFGSIAAILNASATDLMNVPGVSIGKLRAEEFSKAFRRVRPDAEEERAAKLNVRLVAWNEPDYPKVLLKIYDPSLVLYVTGDISACDATCVAMVGTRNPTMYGRETAFRFGYQLASAGYTVVSGMARGIDTESHRGAVQAKGRTVAVLGGALDRFYPAENRKLAHRVVDQGGAVISEYPFGREPDRQTFPMRNRIVSGLSAGVLVVEASNASGTLITVNQALEQGRAVMAIPGRVDSPTSQGCHRLIRDGARLITSLDDIEEELQMMPGLAVPRNPLGQRKKEKAVASSLSEEENKLLEALGDEERTIDEVVERAGLDAGRVNGMLVGLQIKRRLKILPGGRVVSLRGT